MEKNEALTHLAGYFRGELDPGTREEVEAWIEESPENRAIALKVCRLEQYVGQYSLSGEQDSAWILKLAEAIVGNTRRKRRLLAGSVLFRSLGIAAVAALGLFFGSRLGSGDTPYIKFSTGSGEVATVTLPDKSKVWLNANSTLLYPESFEGRERKVRLEGEAFFDVTKDTGHPFTVSVPDCNIKVLGTQFDVSSYPDSPKMQATLVSGSVELSYKTNGRKQRTILYPGQRFSMDVNSGDAAQSYVDAESITSWRTGRVNFNHIPLSDVLAMIGNTFGIRFVIGDNRKLEDTYTGSFVEQSLDEILSTLEAVTDLRFTPIPVAEEDAYPRYSVY